MLINTERETNQYIIVIYTIQSQYSLSQIKHKLSLIIIILNLMKRQYIEIVYISKEREDHQSRESKNVMNTRIERDTKRKNKKRQSK